MKVSIDRREFGLANPNREMELAVFMAILEAELLKLKISGVEIVANVDLPAGDFEIEGLAIIENKDNWNDFKESVFDGRIFDEITRCDDADYPIHVLAYREFGDKVGVLLSLWRDHHTFMFRYRERSELAEFIARIIKRGTKEAGRHTHSKKKAKATLLERAKYFLGYLFTDSIAEQMIGAGFTPSAILAIAATYEFPKRKTKLVPEILKDIKGLGDKTWKRAIEILNYSNVG